MNFKVKVLRLQNLSNWENDRVILPNWSAFLTTQKDSLKGLDLNNFSLYDNDVDTLMKLKLIELKLLHCKFVAPGDPTVTNDSIQSLTIVAYESKGSEAQKREAVKENVRAANKILRCCHAIVTLELQDISLKVEVSQAIASMQTLRNLTIIKCALSKAMKYPSMKVLKVKGCTPAANYKLCTANPQLESFENITAVDEKPTEDGDRYYVKPPRRCAIYCRSREN